MDSAHNREHGRHFTSPTPPTGTTYHLPFCD